MNKLKIIVMISLIMLLSSCYNANQKITKLTKAKDLMTAMEQEGYLTDYDSIESIEVNERVEIEEGIEAFIQHAVLVKGREDETTNGEKHDQLLLLYAIHNPDSEKAIDIWANFEILFLHDHSESNASVKIDMCDIKPGIFCKLRQSPYTLMIAEVEIDEDFIDAITTEPTDIGIQFNYKIEEDAASMFFRKLKDYQEPGSITTTLSLDFSGTH